MTTRNCSLRHDLAAFVDGELRGPRVLRVLHHLDECAACAAEVAALRQLGDRLRAEAPTDRLAPAALQGLASTVVSRSKAEAAQSWLGVLSRAREDWHWVVVGAGAIAATFVSTLILFAILSFGPKAGREDSLSAFITNFRSSAGELYVWATPIGLDDHPMLFEINDRGVAVSSARHAHGAQLIDQAQAQRVAALQQVVTDGGHTIGLQSMDPARRRYAESLLDQIICNRPAGPLPAALTLAVHEMRLYASTTVTAKGL